MGNKIVTFSDQQLEDYQVWIINICILFYFDYSTIIRTAHSSRERRFFEFTNTTEPCVPISFQKRWTTIKRETFTFHGRTSNSSTSSGRIHSSNVFAKHSPGTVWAICRSRTFWICCRCLANKHRVTLKCIMHSRFMVSKTVCHGRLSVL